MMLAVDEYEWDDSFAPTVRRVRLLTFAEVVRGGRRRKKKRTGKKQRKKKSKATRRRAA